MTNALGEDQHPLWKPKFMQTAFAQLVSTIALFSGHLDQSGWVTLTIMIVGQFTAGSVIENKLLKPTVTVTEATKDKARSTVTQQHTEGSPA